MLKIYLGVSTSGFFITLNSVINKEYYGKSRGRGAVKRKKSTSPVSSHKTPDNYFIYNSSNTKCLYTLRFFLLVFLIFKRDFAFPATTLLNQSSNCYQNCFSISLQLFIKKELTVKRSVLFFNHLM